MNYAQFPFSDLSSHFCFGRRPCSFSQRHHRVSCVQFSCSLCRPWSTQFGLSRGLRVCVSVSATFLYWVYTPTRIDTVFGVKIITHVRYSVLDGGPYPLTERETSPGGGVFA